MQEMHIVVSNVKCLDIALVLHPSSNAFQFHVHSTLNILLHINNFGNLFLINLCSL